MLMKKFENILSFDNNIFKKPGIPYIQEEEEISQPRSALKKVVISKDQNPITNYFSKK